MTEIQLKAGLTAQDPRLDRVPFHDARSREYRLRSVLKRWAARSTRSPSNKPAIPTLDQGSDGACVGFSIATMLNASPHRFKPPRVAQDALDLYHAAQRLDEWPGEDYSGTSVLAGMKAAQQAGLIGEYRWLGAGSGRLRDDVVECLETIGSFIAGVPWYGSMFDPEDGGVLRVDPTSGLYGYHAICVLDYRNAPLPGGRSKLEHVVLQNTWGPWGGTWFKQPGHAFVPLDDLINHLLSSEVMGEAVTFIESHAST